MGALEFLGFGIAFTIGAIIGASIMYFGGLIIERRLDE